MFKIFILKLTNRSVIMKRNKFSEEKKTREIKIISEDKFVVEITVKLKKISFSSESNLDLSNIVPEFSLK